MFSRYKCPGTMIEKCPINAFFSCFLKPNVIVDKTKEGEKVKHGKKIPMISFLGHDIKKNHHIHFLVRGHASRSTFSSHLVRGLKGLDLIYFRNRTMEV